MTALIDRIAIRQADRSPVRALTTDDWMQMFSFGNFPLSLNQTLVGNREEIEQTFEGLTWGAYRSNGVIFACVLARLMLFQEARFQWRQRRGGRSGDLFGTAALAPLERPEPGMTTRELLARAILDVDIGGNAFMVRKPGRVRRLRPDWVSIILGSRTNDPEMSPWDTDAEVVGYVYAPGGPGSDARPETFLPEEIAHWAPIPDPLARYRGMSWMLPVLNEILADTAATKHKELFYVNGATPNAVVSFDPSVTLAKAKDWIDVFEEEHTGVMNAWKTAYIGGGASFSVVGKDFQEMDFKAVQGAGEVRITAASGMHPVVVGISEGLQGSALNSGNFMAARRLIADKTMRPLWGGLCGEMERIVPPPVSSELWYDEHDIAFLAEDRKDVAEVMARNAQAIRTLGDGGWDPDSARDAVAANDLHLLKHTGMLSVQVQPPGSGSTDGEPPPVAGAWQQVHPPSELLRRRVEGQAVSSETFWAVTGTCAGEWVEEGQVLDANHPVVRAFPHLFDYQATGTPLALPGPAPIVTRAQVIEARERRLAAGLPAGYDSLARELNVHRDTIRRRLKEAS